MCTVSMVAADWTQRWPQYNQPYIFTSTEVTRAEFDALKAELEKFKKLLKAAKLYDEETGQPDCEEDEKVKLFRRLAELTGVDITDVFKQPTA